MFYYGTIYEDLVNKTAETYFIVNNDNRKTIGSVGFEKII